MSDFYGSLIDAGIYHLARGNAEWAAAASDGVREAALLNASEYVDSFAAKYPGSPTGGRLQVRYWPAKDVTQGGEDVPDTEVPREILYATYEAALLIVKGVDLRPNAVGGGAVKRKRVKAGPAEVETEFMDSASSGTTFAKIEDLLSVWYDTSKFAMNFELLRA